MLQRVFHQHRFCKMKMLPGAAQIIVLKKFSDFLEKSHDGILLQVEL